MKQLCKQTSLVAVGVVAGLAVSPPAVQAAVNYFDTTKVVYGTGTVYCPSGWKLTGGGVGQLPSDYFGMYYSDEYQLTGSWPSSSTAWKATGKKVHGSYSSTSGWRFSTYSYSPRVNAVCAS